MVVDKITTSLPFVFINPEVIVYKVSSTQVFYKLLVMCDNHKLKVPLLSSSSDNSAKKNQQLHLKCQRVFGTAMQIVDTENEK